VIAPARVANTNAVLKKKIILSDGAGDWKKKKKLHVSMKI